MATHKKNQKKSKNNETVAESFEYFLRWLLSALVSLYAVFILAVLPFYSEQGFTHIGTDKSTFFRACTVRMSYFVIPVLLGWVVFKLVTVVKKACKESDWKPAVSLCLPDYFAFAYGFCVILSYLCSSYKDTALWGTKGWYMGMLPHLTLVAIYFLVSRFQMGAKWMLYLIMAVSSVVFALGYLNRFDVWLLPMENSGLPMFISTVGNINWYCGYMVSVVFIGIGLFWLDNGEKKWYTLLLAAYTCLGFATMITQGSDSGLFALAFVWLVMFVLSAKSEKTERMKRFWLMIGLFALACMITLVIRLLFPEKMNYSTGIGNLLTATAFPLLIGVVAGLGWWFAGRKGARRVWKRLSKSVCVAVPVVIVVFVLMITANTLNPGSLGAVSDQEIFTFDNKWGSARGATWKLGAMCFAEQGLGHKMVGVGPDCMVDYLYKGGSDGLKTALKEAFPSKRLTNAHNELLTILVNEGVCGLVAFVGLFFALLKKLLGHCENNSYAAVCGLCMVAYTANNVWSFQQSLSVSTIFVIMGLGARFWLEKKAD